MFFDQIRLHKIRHLTHFTVDLIAGVALSDALPDHVGEAKGGVHRLPAPPRCRRCAVDQGVLGKCCQNCWRGCIGGQANFQCGRCTCGRSQFADNLGALLYLCRDLQVHLINQGRGFLEHGIEPRPVEGG